MKNLTEVVFFFEVVDCRIKVGSLCLKRRSEKDQNSRENSG